MKDEAEACRILKNSFILQGHHLYKIPDPSSDWGSTIQRPFDLFGRYQDKSLYIECKYSNGLKSFNLDSIQEHQIEGLLEFSKIKDSLCYIFLAVRVSRGDSRFYFWPIQEIYSRYLSKENFKKKELETLPYYHVKKSSILEDIKLGEKNDKQ